MERLERMDESPSKRQKEESEQYMYWGSVFERLVVEWTVLFSTTASDDAKCKPKKAPAWPNKGDRWEKAIWLEFISDWTAPPDGDVTIDGRIVKMGYAKFAELHRFWYSFCEDSMRKAWKAAKTGDYRFCNWNMHDKGSAVLIRFEMTTEVIVE